jgi:hypothetical protein
MKQKRKKNGVRLHFDDTLVVLSGRTEIGRGASWIRAGASYQCTTKTSCASPVPHQPKFQSTQPIARFNRRLEEKGWTVWIGSVPTVKTTDKRRIAQRTGSPFSGVSPAWAHLRMLIRLVLPTMPCSESAPSSMEEPDMRRVRFRVAVFGVWCFSNA